MEDAVVGVGDCKVLYEGATPAARLRSTGPSSGKPKRFLLKYLSLRIQI